RAVHICFLFANSRHLLQRRKIGGSAAAQLLQRSVVQNNVGGHFVLPRHISPPFAQILRQGRISLRRRRVPHPRFFGWQQRRIERRKRRGRKRCLPRRDLRRLNSHLLLQPLGLGAAIVAVSAALPFRSLAEVQT